MEKQRADFSCDTDVAEDAVDRSLLRQAVDNHDRMLWMLPFPFFALCALMWGRPNFDMMVAIVGMQACAYVFVWRANARLRNALDLGLDTVRQIRWTAAAVALTGTFWGLALLPAVDSIAWGVAPMFIILTVVVCVAVCAFMDAPVRIFAAAACLGFVVGGAPLYWRFANGIGLVPAISILLFGPGMMWLMNVIGKHIRKFAHNELQNAQLAAHLQSALDTAEYLSQRDSLTALLNRRAFEREAASFRGKSASPQPAQIILFDLDHFKFINDNHGHSTGDAVLKTIAETMERVFSGPLPDSFTHVRTGRWGGEEFIVLLGGASAHSAWAIAEILRSSVSATHRKDWPKGLGITASFGISEWLSKEPLHEAIARADEAMYRAKNRGRDCVEMSRAEGQIEQDGGLRTIIARG